MNYRKTIVPLLVALCALAVQAAAQTSAPQPTATPRPTTVLVVNYIKAKDGFVKNEREVWTPFQKEVVKAGNLAGWSVWSVRWAAKNSEYDFITVDAYKNWASMEKSPYTAELFAKAHPGKNAEEMMKRTGEVRDIVRRDVLGMIAQTEAVAGAPTAKYVIVDYYQSTPDKRADYVKLERETYLPMHQEAVKQGKLAFWQFYTVIGAGSENSYGFITVRGYAKWEDIGGGGGPAVLTKVHPNMKPEDLAKTVREARTLAKSQILTLVEQVLPPAPAGQ